MATSSYIKTFVLVATLAVLLSSCLNEQVAIPPYSNSIQVNVMLPQSTPPINIRRAIQTPAEAQLNEVYILVFENGAYSYSVQGGNIVNSANGIATFNIRLNTSNQEVILYILANSADALAANPPLAGETLAQVTAKLARAFTSAGTSGNASLWGSYTLPTGITPTTPATINLRLLRAVARVDVVVLAPTSNFQLASVQAFRAANSLQLIPNNPSATPDVSAPSVLSGTLYNVNTNPIAATSNSVTAQLYLPEAVAPDAADQVGSATCVVVGGYLNGSATLSYYRLDFNPTVSGNPLGQLLRNNLYQFNIRQVVTEGYATPDEAAANPSVGMLVDLIQWDAYEIINIFFNNDAYIGLSHSLAVLPGTISAINVTVQSSDAYQLAFSDANGVPIGDFNPAFIISDFFSVLVMGNGTLLINTLSDNPAGSDDRIEYVILRSGTLDVFLTLMQEEGTQNWASGNVDAFGTFADIGQPGLFYQWNGIIGYPTTGTVVGWSSAGIPGSEWATDRDPCPTGWRVPTSDELDELRSSPGQRWREASADYPFAGVWLAPTQAEADAATLAEPGNAIFLPAVGARDSFGSLFNAGSNGYYWGSNTDDFGNTYQLTIANGTTLLYPANNRAHGFCVRCIRE